MRLFDFIIANSEPIVRKWSLSARSFRPGPADRPLVLQEHAADLLHAMASELKSSQIGLMQCETYLGMGHCWQGRFEESGGSASVSSNHHSYRPLSSWCELQEVLDEYRVLRAVVIQGWLAHSPGSDSQSIGDVIRFNEIMDQSVAESIDCFVRRFETSNGCLLGLLGHDLRSPLAGATMIAHLLGDSKTLDAQGLQMVDTLLASLDAADQVIRDLLDFTAIQSGARIEVVTRPLDMKKVCREVLNELKAEHPSKTFVFICPNEADFTGDWDEARIRQLISNLSMNAVQHGPASTPVTLTISPGETCVCMEFHYMSPPIPAETLAVMFDPPLRPQFDNSSGFSGSVGLELYVAREVTRAHGGTISVDSTDHKTIFTVILPRGRPEMSARNALETVTSSHHRNRGITEVHPSTTPPAPSHPGRSEVLRERVTG